MNCFATKTFAHRLRLVLGAAAVLAFISGGASATDPEDFHFDTTEDLYDVCATSTQAPEHVPAILACRAFIEATVQYHDQVVNRENLKRLVCYDKTATIEQARVAFVAWAKENRRNKTFRTEQPVVGLMRALSAAYPCR
jgi:hypothetical protein